MPLSWYFWMQVSNKEFAWRKHVQRVKVDREDEKTFPRAPASGLFSYVGSSGRGSLRFRNLRFLYGKCVLCNFTSLEAQTIGPVEKLPCSNVITLSLVQSCRFTFSILYWIELGKQIRPKDLAAQQLQPAPSPHQSLAWATEAKHWKIHHTDFPDIYTDFMNGSDGPSPVRWELLPVQMDFTCKPSQLKSWAV